MFKRFAGTFLSGSALLWSVAAHAQQSPHFVTGNLVVAVEGCGIYGGTCTAVANGHGNGTGNSSSGGYGDNQAAPLSLFQFAPAGTKTATFVNSLALPQTNIGGNLPVSGEYGSSSEGNLQLSSSGKYLTLMGYGVNAAAFNANPPLFGAAPTNALGQSGSLTGQSYTAVPRVVALIDANGFVNSTTGLYNIFNTNNPRSAYTVDGTTVYVSGQGNAKDATGGVFYTAIGAINKAPTPITGLITTNNMLSQDTREVQIFNNTLYTSIDSKEGTGSARSFIGTLGTPGTLPTTTVGAPTMLKGFGNTGGTGKVTIGKGATDNGNGLNAGSEINLSPISYFFANASTLYVADGGNGKQTSAGTTIGDGGLQKWANTKADGTGTWSLIYTLHKGLNLVLNTSATGTSGLYGLTGSVSGDTVELYATNSTITDLDPTFLFGITDSLSNTSIATAATLSFTTLAAAPSDSNFKGVSFAPTVPGTAAPLIAISNDLLTYTGSPLPVTVTTDPAELATTVSYNGSSSAPSAAGTYLVSASINGDSAISGTARALMLIRKAGAGITLGNLAHYYTGTAIPATATTNPLGLSVTLLYNGSATPPSAVGRYVVNATIYDANYTGSINGFLSIDQIPATVMLGNMIQTFNGSPRPVTVTTNPAGLAVSITYNGSPTPPTAKGSYLVVATITDTNYTGTNRGIMLIR